MEAEAAYEARGISQHYGPVTALHDVSVVIRPAEVHAILGANGAGKSTLMKILAGAEQPSTGTLVRGGKVMRFASPQAAERAGIAWVAQELTLYGDLDVLENLFLGREPRRGPLVDRSQMRRVARTYLARVGLDPDLDGPVRLLRLGERQRLEIARALIQQPRILILDEPTSALDAVETQRLLEVIRTLRESGVGVVLVSHFLEDVFAIADVITVLRDGRRVLDAVATAALTPESTIESMLGARQEAAEQSVARRRFETTAPSSALSTALRLRGIGVRGVLESTSFDVRAGEVVALAGLEGSGTSLILELIYGQRRADSGTIELPGGGSAPVSIADAVRAGVSYIPADRGRIGLFAEQSVVDNISVVRSLALAVNKFVLRRSTAQDRARERIAQLRIKVSSLDLPVKQLSGGNQQKVVFAKWLEADPLVYLLDDPTRGVDVGTRAAMHEVIRDLADHGAVVIIVSSDLDELCRVADRAEVFFHGRRTHTIEAAELSPHSLLEAINTGTVRAAGAARG